MQGDNGLDANSKMSVGREASAPGSDTAKSIMTLAAVSIAYVAVAAGWRALGLPSGATPQSGYQFTRFVVPSFLWLLFVFANIGLVAGFITGRTWVVGFGLLLPIAVSMILEMSKDPTSHNLFPFEILITWIPAFLFAFVAARVGRRFRGKEVGDAKQRNPSGLQVRPGIGGK